MSPLRPLGYFLWGVLWLLIPVMLLAVPPLILWAKFNDRLTGGGDGGSVLFAWLIGVPVCAWLFVIVPIALLSQAGIGFVAAALSLQAKYSETQLVEFVGSASRRTMEPRVNVPAMRLLAATSAVGWIPGWVFAGSAMAVTAGLGVVLAASSTPAVLAGAAIVTVGAGGVAIGIRTRINDELKKPPPGGVDKFGLTAKYYKGLRYREGKRARDLQNARDAGRAGDIDTWGRAEAAHALRTYPFAKLNARKNVPGALDTATDAVAAAMQIPRAQAEQFVIDAAAYRGTKPVPVRVTQ